MIALVVGLACSPSSGGTGDSQGTGGSSSDGSGSSGSDSGPNPTSTATATATATMGSNSGDATGTGEPTSATSSTGDGETGGSSGALTSGDATTGTASETGDTTIGGTTSGGSTTDASGSTGGDTTGGGEPNPLWDEPNLWYSVDKSLIYIQIDPANGSVVKLVHNQLMSDVPLWHGQNGLTMLEGGALLGSRESAQGTQIYWVPDPPIAENTPANAKFLGTIAPDKGQNPPRIEALYTDCDGRVYLMDTGVDVSNSSGNRLLRFSGDYLSGDLSYEVITDLQKASVGDIDDMSPGIVDGEINDKLGFAIDSTVLWQIDYTVGTGMNLATTSGTWGVHALGGPLFDDAEPRLYVLSQNAGLYEVSLADYTSSPMLVQGPNLMLQNGNNGWSGLAGPLTDCVTLIPQ